MIKYLDKVPDNEIVELNLPTGKNKKWLKKCIEFELGIPLVYELDENLNPIKHYYVAPDDVVQKAIDQVANQGKAKK